MSRRQLSVDICAAERQAADQCHRLRISNRQQAIRLRAAPPLVLVGAGLAAGFLTGTVSARWGATLDGTLRRALRLGGLVNLLFPFLPPAAKVSTGEL